MDALDYTVVQPTKGAVVADHDPLDHAVTPSARANAATCANTERDELIVFGGIGTHEFYNDLFTLSVGTMAWQQHQPGGAGPSSRGGAAMCITTLSTGEQRVTLFGGRSDEGLHSDLYSVDLSTFDSWLRHVPSGDRPTAREDSLAISGAPDALGGCSMVLIGGVNARQEPLADVWVYNPTRGTWSAAQQSGAAPWKGLAGASACKIGSDRAVVFGGFDRSSFSNMLRLLDLRSFCWRELEATGAVPRPRTHASAALIGHSLYLYSGYAGTTVLNDLWRIDLSDAWLTNAAFQTVPMFCWETVDLPAKASAPRGAAASVAGMLPDGRRSFVVFGGYDGSLFLNTVLVVRLGVPKLSYLQSSRQAHYPSPQSNALMSHRTATLEAEDSLLAKRRFDRGEDSAVNDLRAVVDNLRSVVQGGAAGIRQVGLAASSHGGGGKSSIVSPPSKKALESIRKRSPPSTRHAGRGGGAKTPPSSYDALTEQLMRENEELRLQLKQYQDMVATTLHHQQYHPGQTDTFPRRPTERTPPPSYRPFDADFL